VCIKYIFDLLSEGAHHHNLSSVIGIVRSIVDMYPESCEWLTPTDEIAKELTESFDTLQYRIIESLPECSKDFVDNEFNEFADAFEYYQECTGIIINEFSCSDVDGFNTVCTEFVTQLAIARDAVVKLLAVRNLDLFITVMLARERHMQLTQEDGACTRFATEVAMLPSVRFEMIAGAIISNGEEVEP
jgi:hypothetical protein